MSFDWRDNSADAFNGEPSQPERLTAGYPQIMIQWMRQRDWQHR